MVSARHPTWQGHEWAIRCTEVLVWIVTLILAWLIWPWIPPLELVIRIVMFIGAVCAAGSVAAFFLRRSITSFLARTLFATKTVFWFSPEAIAFQSRKYARPVIMWRKWNSSQVRIRFLVVPDHDAKNLLDDVRDARKRATRLRFPTVHLEEAEMLGVIVTTADFRSHQESKEMIIRRLPITEINSRLSVNFTMVYAAAVNLTAPQQDDPKNRAKQGVDIDA